MKIVRPFWHAIMQLYAKILIFVQNKFQYINFIPKLMEIYIILMIREYFWKKITATKQT